MYEGLEAIGKLWEKWMQVPMAIRFLAYIGIFVLVISALSGCATSVSYKMGDCSTKMSGLFFAHGLSPSNASDCKPDTY